MEEVVGVRRIRIQWRLVLFLLAIVAISVGGGGAAARAVTASSYFAVDLGTLGGSISSAVDVNESGQVVGSSTTASGETHAFSWTQAGGMVDLGTLGGPTSSATAVNDEGRVVGASTTSAGESHAFSWTQAGGMVDLGTLGGTTSWPTDLNDAGDVVGDSLNASNDFHAFLWTPGRGMTDLGTLGGLTSSANAINAQREVVGMSTDSASATYVQAFIWTKRGGMVNIGADLGAVPSQSVDVNDNGQVVGYSQPPSGLRAFSWTPTGGMVTLGTLGGTSSYATAVNDAGQVVGASAPAGQTPVHVFLWAESSPMLDLGTLGGSFSNSGSRGLSEGGQIVGSSSTAASEKSHAFSWTQGDGMVDLGTLGGISSGAYAVNDQGWIVGRSAAADGYFHAALWRPRGSLSICKAAANGAAGASFAFTATNLATGAKQVLSVGGGTCSRSVPADPGSYKVQEDTGAGLWTMAGAFVIPTSLEVSENDSAGWVKVEVIENTETQVTITNAPAAATLMVCKWSKSRAIRGSSLAFTVGDQTVTATARTKASPGCSGTVTIQPGSRITVSESVPAGEQVASIAAGGNLTINGSRGSTATVTIGPGVNRITYENEPVGPS